GYHDDAVVLSQLLSLDDPLVDGVQIVRDLGDQDGLRTAGQTGPQGDKAGLPAHHLHYVDPLVASGRVPDLVDPVDHRIDRRVKADGNVGAGDVVVDGGGNADGGHAHRGQGHCPAERPVAADEIGRAHV